MRRVGCVSRLAGAGAVIGAAAMLLAAPESVYIARAAAQLKGQAEVPVLYGRADITTGVLAVEVDKLDNFKEGVGQALYYGWMFNKRPALVLVCGTNDLAKYRAVKRIIEQHSAITVMRIDADSFRVTK